MSKTDPFEQDATLGVHAI